MTSSIFPKYNKHKDIIIISQIIINHLIKLGCCERNSKCLFNKVDIVVNNIPIPKISEEFIFIVKLNNEFLETNLGSFFQNFINDDDDLFEDFDVINLLLLSLLLFFDFFEKENTLVVVDLDGVCLFFRRFIVKKKKNNNNNNLISFFKGNHFVFIIFFKGKFIYVYYTILLLK
jgi:hypothetical protein